MAISTLPGIMENHYYKDDELGNYICFIQILAKLKAMGTGVQTKCTIIAME